MSGKIWARVMMAAVFLALPTVPGCGDNGPPATGPTSPKGSPPGTGGSASDATAPGGGSAGSGTGTPHEAAPGPK